MAWTQGGGDWTDADGAANGPKPLRNGTPAGADGIMTIDIAGIDGDLFLRRGANFDAAFIDGEPATAFWMHPTSNRAMAPPTQYLADESTAIVLNPKRGKGLTLHVTRPWGMEVFKLRTPAVVDYPMLANPAGLLPPDMGTLDPVSQAVVYAAVGQGAGASVEYWAYDPQPGVDAAHGNLPYLRCAITPQNQKGIGWFWWHEPKTEIYERFCLWLEDDIALGMTELGVKLPGPEGGEGMSWRMLQGRPDRANPGLYAILDYRYSADSGGGFGVETPGYAGTLVKTGRWYVFEQHVRANTFNADGSARNDGVAEFWLNNHPINRSDAIRWFDAATGRFEKFFINLYHGGMGLPTQDIHYRIAKLARSTTRIGVPRELLLA